MKITKYIKFIFYFQIVIKYSKDICAVDVLFGKILLVFDNIIIKYNMLLHFVIFLF